jgi:REP-associated tyrosine transposase
MPCMLTPQAHRERVKHHHEPGDLHELTFSCYRRMPLLTNDDWRIRLSRTIDEAGRQSQVDLVAFVFMPEHIHLIVAPSTSEPDIGRYLALVKQPFSKSIKQLLVETGSPLLERLTVRERPGKLCFRFWQEGPGYDRNLNTPAAVEASIDYLHLNPVRRGFCHQAVNWKWSSASSYLLDPPRRQDSDLPHIHGLPLGALDPK